MHGHRTLPLALSAGFILACHSSRPAPAPTIATLHVTTSAPPREALHVAAEQLTHDGFMIVAVDSAAGLRAEREHRPGELGTSVACRVAENPAVRASLAPTLIINLAAEPRPNGGSELTLESRVRAVYLRLTAEPARPSSDSDCHSTGVVERLLAERLTSHAQ